MLCRVVACRRLETDAIALWAESSLAGLDRHPGARAARLQAEEEVTVENRIAGVRLAGTLTLPRGPGPHRAVVLITGSGPQDRDESIMGHRPFLVLADHLTCEGIAVLRCDDRGVGKSTGNHGMATGVDFVEDALAAGGNQRVKTVEFPGLNHLLQTRQTGAVAEYGRIEETFNPAALKLIRGEPRPAEPPVRDGDAVAA